MSPKPPSDRETRYRIQRFLGVGIRSALSGSRYYYAWLAGLTVFLVLGFYTYLQQTHHGLIITSARHLSPWATLSYAQFPFFDGLAAGVIVVVVLGSIYGREDFRSVEVFAWALAASAAIVSVASVLSMLGNFSRLFYIFPVVGTPNFPHSMLPWDVIALNAFIAICLGIPAYVLFKRYHGERPNPGRRYFVYLAIVFAVFIQAVVAAILIVNPVRDLWFTALMAPRFITSALAASAALMVLVLLAIRRLRPAGMAGAGIEIEDRALHTLGHVAVLAIGLNLFSIASEIFTLTWPGTDHGFVMEYLLVGLTHQGVVYDMLTPVMWISLLLEIGAVVILLQARRSGSIRTLAIGSGAVVVGVFLEKGIIIFISAFIVSPLGEVYEPSFTLPEVVMAISLWALGALLFTLLSKAGIGILAEARPVPDRDED